MPKRWHVIACQRIGHGALPIAKTVDTATLTFIDETFRCRYPRVDATHEWSNSMGLRILLPSTSGLVQHADSLPPVLLSRDMHPPLGLHIKRSDDQPVLPVPESVPLYEVLGRRKDRVHLWSYTAAAHTFRISGVSVSQPSSRITKPSSIRFDPVGWPNKLISELTHIPARNGYVAFSSG